MEQAPCTHHGRAEKGSRLRHSLASISQRGPVQGAGQRQEAGPPGEAAKHWPPLAQEEAEQALGTISWQLAPPRLALQAQEAAQVRAGAARTAGSESHVRREASVLAAAVVAQDVPCPEHGFRTGEHGVLSTDTMFRPDRSRRRPKPARSRFERSEGERGDVTRRPEGRSCSGASEVTAPANEPASRRALSRGRTADGLRSAANLKRTARRAMSSEEALYT